MYWERASMNIGQYQYDVQVNDARKRNIHIVTPDWLWSCSERWERVSVDQWEASIYPWQPITALYCPRWARRCSRWPRPPRWPGGPRLTAPARRLPSQSGERRLDYTHLIFIRSSSGRRHVLNNFYFTDVLILTSTWMVASTGSRVWRRLTHSWPSAPGTSRTWTRRWRTSSAGTATVTVTLGAEGWVTIDHLHCTHSH